VTSKLRTRPPLPTYLLIEDPLDDIYSVSIQSGTCAGLVFKFRQVRFVPEGSELQVKFNYSVVSNPNQLTAAQATPIMGVILDDILKKDLHGPH
jgi:hypothetical protein